MIIQGDQNYVIRMSQTNENMINWGLVPKTENRKQKTENRKQKTEKY